MGDVSNQLFLRTMKPIHSFAGYILHQQLRFHSLNASAATNKFHPVVENTPFSVVCENSKFVFNGRSTLDTCRARLNEWKSGRVFSGHAARCLLITRTKNEDWQISKENVL